MAVSQYPSMIKLITTWLLVSMVWELIPIVKIASSPEFGGSRDLGMLIPGTISTVNWYLLKLVK